MHGKQLIVVLLLLVSCASDPKPSADPTSSPSSGVPVYLESSEAQRYGSLQEIARAFDCTGLKNVGTGGEVTIRAFGVCAVGRHNIDIYLVRGTSFDYLLSQFAGVKGPGWVIVTPTGGEAARIVHERLGGRLAIP